MSTKGPKPTLVRLMESGDFSDLKFVCDEREFNVHKAIVCGQSPVINAAVKGEFEESISNAISMHNFKHDTIQRLIQFMYTGDYDDPNKASLGEDEVMKDDIAFQESKFDPYDIEETEIAVVYEEQPALPLPESTFLSSLLEHIQVSSIGEYYGVDGLVSLANTKIKHLLRSSREYKDLVKSLPTAITAALESTGDNELLDILATETAANISTLLKSRSFTGLDVISDQGGHQFNSINLALTLSCVDSLLIILPVELNHLMPELN